MPPSGRSASPAPRGRGLRPLPLDLPAGPSRDELRSALFAPPPPPVPVEPEAVAVVAPDRDLPSAEVSAAIAAEDDPLFGPVLRLRLPSGPAWSYAVRCDDGDWRGGWPSALSALRCGYWERPRERLAVAPVQHLDCTHLATLALRDWPLLLAGAAHDLDPRYTVRVSPEQRQQVTGALARAIAEALGAAFVPPSAPARVEPGVEIEGDAALYPADSDRLRASIALGLYDHDGATLPTRFFADILRALAPRPHARTRAFLGDLLASVPTATRHDLAYFVSLAERCLQHVL